MAGADATERYQAWLVRWTDVQAHLPRLYELGQGNVLELGVRGGVSTSALLAGVEARGGHVWSVDRDDCGPVYAGHSQWTFVCADSCDTLALGAAGLPGEFDGLFIDTAHTAEQTLRELTTWGWRVRRGGAILLHDTDDPSTYPGVREAIEQWVAERPYATVIYHEGSYGLGEIRL